MTTETEVKKASAWTPEQEAIIAELTEKRGMTRSNAVRKMRADEARGLSTLEHVKANLVSAVSAKMAGKPVAKAKAAKPAAKAERAERSEITPQKQVHIDELVRKTIGSKAAVENETLHVYKSSLQPNYSRYIWYGLSDGRVLSVNPDAMTTRFLDPTSKSAKGWLRMQARALKIGEAKIAKADAKAAKAAKASAK